MKAPKTGTIFDGSVSEWVAENEDLVHEIIESAYLRTLVASQLLARSTVRLRTSRSHQLQRLGFTIFFGLYSTQKNLH